MVGFILFDPQDPMLKIVEKVQIEDRPALLAGRNKKPGDKSWHRRHIIAHDIIAKALRKILKGLPLGAIADWLDTDKCWLDQKYIKEDRFPCTGVGKVIRTVYGVQAATDGWLKNATNFADNIFPGPKATNLQIAALYREGRATVKREWKGNPIPLTRYSKIYCCEASSGLPTRFESIGKFFDQYKEVINIINTEYIFKAKAEYFFRAEEGSKFVGVPSSFQFDKALQQYKDNDWGSFHDRYKGVFTTLNPQQQQQLNNELADKWLNLKNQADILRRFIASNVKQFEAIGGGMIFDNRSASAIITPVARDFNDKKLNMLSLGSGGTSGFGGPPVNANLEKGQRMFVTGAVDVGVDIKTVSVGDYTNAINNLKIIRPTLAPNGEVQFQVVTLFEAALGQATRGKYYQASLKLPYS